MKPLLNIQLLGDFQFSFRDEPIRTFNAERPQALLCYLLLHRRAPQSRHHVAFNLWPDSSESQALSNLRNLLHRIRRALPHADDFIVADKLTLQWRADAQYLLDVAQFEAALERAKSTDLAEVEQQLVVAVELYRGDLLPGNYDDWIIPLRAELQQRYRDALSQLIDLLENASEYQAAIQHCQRLLRLDPLDESVYILQMRLHSLNGDRSGVRQTFEQCVAVLRNELDADPDPMTQSAYHEYVHAQQSQKVLPPAGWPRRRSTRVIQTKPLPTYSSPFLGREQELTQLGNVIIDPKCHLLTLVGLGGIGKTRLAVELAKQHAKHFVDGSAFVPLAGLTEFEQLILALAEAFNLPSQTQGSAVDLVVKELWDKQMLVVLDNMEQLVHEASQLPSLFDQLSNYTWLVTSRERLHLQEEWVYELRGLSYISGHGDQAEESAAGALFLHYANRTRHSFVPTADDVIAIQQICRLVDGMPLGIELAASWVHVLSCLEIAEEIEHNLDFLASPVRNVPQRHRTLLSVFDHSWSLLSREEQRAFRQLSVFRGGFDRAEANQIADVGFDTLVALVDKSLVYRNGGGRFEMHERVRQYAFRKLYEADEAIQTRDRFLHFYLTFAETKENELSSRQEPYLLMEIEKRYSNMRSALQWALEESDTNTAEIGGNSSTGSVIPERTQAGMKLAAALASYWYLSDHLNEGQEWLQKALSYFNAGSYSDTAELVHIHARLLFGLGSLTGAMSNHEEANNLLRRSQNLYGVLNDRHGVGFALSLSNAPGVEQPHAADISNQDQECVHLNEEKSPFFAREISDKSQTSE